MVLSIATWRLLESWRRGDLKQVGAVARRTGSQSAVEDLLGLGHVKLVGGKLDRTKRSVDAFGVFGLLPPDGGTVGNARLQRESGLSDGAYNRAKSLLIASGEATVGPGRGGTLRRTADVDVDDRAGRAAKESDLYEPLRLGLLARPPAVEQAELTFRSVSIVGHGGGQTRATGEWSKPDILEIVVTDDRARSRNLPSLRVTVSSYEVKQWRDAHRLLGAYEASAHKRFAHVSTLVVEHPDEAALLPRLDAVAEECRRLGTGLMRIWRGRLVEMVEPVRHEPDRRLLDDFLGEMVPPSRLDELQVAVGRAGGGGPTPG